MAFAASWAELVFASYPSLEIGRKNYAYLKGEVGATVTCQLQTDTGKIDILVTVSKVDPANFLAIYTFKQK